MQAFPVRRMMDHLDTKNRRPFEQWWLSIATVIPVVSMPRGDVIPVEIPIEDADHVVTY